MLRYATALIIAALLLAVALNSRSGGDAGTPATDGDEVVASIKPDLELEPAADGGLDLRLRHRFAGAVSRATLIYELDGSDCTLDRTTNCQRRLNGATKLGGDGYESEVTLGGHLPKGFSALRLVLEDETGTRVVSVSLD